MSITVPPNTCDSCRLMISCLAGRSENKFTQHSLSVADLAKSAKICPACLIIWTRITPAKRRLLLQAEASELIGGDVPIFKFTSETDGSTEMPRESGIFWQEDQNRVDEIFFSFHCPVAHRYGLEPFKWDVSLCGLPGQKPEDLKAKDISFGCDSTSGESTLGQIRSWLNKCQKTHIPCKGLQSTDWLPTRLIETGAGEDQVRLRLGSDIPPGTSYLALSHCWGRKEAIKLTESTCDELFTGISLTQLPKTFQDAVDVTKRLGFIYLWIDSLCIIQDDRADWDRECGLMERVYENCVLDLASMHSENCFGGCYTSRAPFILNDVLVVIDNSILNIRLSYDFLGRDKEPSKLVVFRLTGRHHYWRDLMDGPLGTRAWVLQETFLAPRVLYFCENMVAWECRSLLASEAEPEGVYTGTNRHGGALRGKSDLFNQLTNPEISPWELWSFLVEVYTKRKRTVYEDKLVAFAGMAKTIQATFTKRSGGMTPEYLAGLWSENLELQLTWHRVQEVPKELEADSYIAPSWSWASMEGPVSFHSEYGWGKLVKERILIVVHGYSITPLGPDPFLHVTSGSLSLQGWLWKLSSKQRSKQEYKLVDVWDDLRGSVTPGLTAGLEDNEKYLETYFLPVYHNQSLVTQIKCLCLQPTGFGGGQFRRIGVAWIRKPPVRVRDISPSSSDEEKPPKRRTSPDDTQLLTTYRRMLQEALIFHWETQVVITPLEAEDENVAEVEVDTEEENGLIRCRYTIEIV